FISKGTIERPQKVSDSVADHSKASKKESNLVLTIGVLALLFVPVFKNVTHLPPFMGMLFSLSILWIITELLHRKKIEEHKENLKVASIIRKIDTPSVLFFLG